MPRLRAFIITVVALFPALGRAQMPDANSLQELEQAGYVTMNKITTPLLYPAYTAKPYNLKVLLVSGRADMPKDAQEALAEVSYSRDEFKVHALLERYRPFVEEQMATLKQTGGYLVPLRFQLGEYDFDHHRFPLKLTLAVNKSKSADGLHCAGAYDKFQNMAQTACISISNWNENSGAFQFLAIDEQSEAQRIKQMLVGGKAGFYFVTARDGAFRLATGAPLRVGNFLDQALVAGTQPARVIGLVLVELATGQILVAGPLPNAGPGAPARPGAKSKPNSPPPSSRPAVASATASQAPGDAVTADTAPAPLTGSTSNPTAATAPADGQPIIVGVPDDTPTLRLDKLLAALAYAAYSDPEKVAVAQKTAQQIQEKFARIQNDSGRDPVIQAHELKELQPKLDAAVLKLEELQAQMALKDQVAREYGAEPVVDAALTRVASAGHVYFERYRLTDGRQIMVFRGTDNGQDLWTDLQIGMTPELAKELVNSIKTASGRAMVTGASRVSAGEAHPSPASTGRPAAFSVADALVKKIIQGGTPADRLILSGHSLGGGYAQYAGLRSNVAQIVAFNPAPLSAQLQKDASGEHTRSTIRHYVSFVTTRQSKSGAYGDPVSQLTTEYLNQPEIAGLKVIGKQYAVPVCVDLRGPEYRAFSHFFQDGIKHMTLSSIDHGFRTTKKVGSIVGQTEGMVTASTDQESAMKSGAKVGKVPGKVAGTAAYCLKHPYLCGGKVALGGAASVLTKTELTPRAWTILSAHKMKNLEEAIENDGQAVCEDPQTQLAPST
ncbi:hypothetical protein [Massilia sp. TS11]|uniref:hypothetical protein n=1 Tax=Massilia sp. TS11 TaxID=2908003 RepID=UPI001ED9CBD7|nr:hypothetical protein [Massilia sp. TS11]MCG2583907.1 hypothetical protein [Massilia sp. TS11]